MKVASSHCSAAGREELRGISSVGRAPVFQTGGESSRRFETGIPLQSCSTARVWRNWQTLLV